MKRVSIKGRRTIIVALLIAISGFLADANVQTYIAQNLPWATTGVAAIMIVLRAITNSPIGKPE